MLTDGIFAGTARNQGELDQAIELAAEVFLSDKESGLDVVDR